MSAPFIPTPEPIAIVGIGCRFPGADGPDAFWDVVRSGVDAIADMPAGRFDADALFDPNPGARGRIITRQGGFLRDVDRFDPSFFGISPREAACVDPQQRLLLEVAWEAFEDGGLTRERLAGTATSVFVGMWTNEYEDRMFGASSDIDLYVTTGGGRYAASGRLSYAFDLRGPSLTLDTACSSSLVAVHLACQSLRSGESDMALAAGTNIILEPHISIGYSRSSMLSADARCRFGDAAASGYVRSEGVGVIVLKPLSRALAEGDRIRALIRGSAVNNDGRGSDVLVAPSAAVQAAMLRRAYQAAGVVPGHVGYVEAHGTGTRVGDPVELTALGEVLAEGREPGRPCRVGSVKTNIGHAEAASGIAGLIKVVLCLEHRVIPPSLHFDEPNPRIPWDRLPLRIVRSLEPWPAEFRPALAGVNSFGVTGTNAHVVLEEAPPAARPVDEAGARPIRLLALSAKSTEALRALADRWVPVLEREEATADLADLCYTANVRRTHHEHRLAVVGATREEMAERLRAHLAGQARAGVAVGQTRADRPRVVFVFPGQGSQWLGMGRRLLETEPVFRAALERCARALALCVDWSLLGELEADPARSQLHRIDVVQPALFAIQIALATLWRALGVEPDAVVGHSMGEVAAAHVAGALSLDDAARVIATRSRLLRRIAGQGAMAMVELSLEGAREALRGREDRLSIAVSNSARSTVLSGDTAALGDLLAELEGRGVFCRPIRVDVASHSPHVDPLCADLLAELRGLAPRPTTLPLCSTVTGETATGESLGAAYWVRNLREPVLFMAAVERLIADGGAAFIEMSPHPALLAALQEALAGAAPGRGIALASGRRDDDEQVVVRESLGALWARGFPLDWAHLSPPGARVVPLPAYPWQRERFWFDESRRAGGPRPAGHPLLATHVALAAEPGAHVWDGSVPATHHPCLSGIERPVLGAAACLDAVLAAAGEVGPGPATLLDVGFPELLALDSDRVAVQIEMRLAEAGRRFRVLGRGTGAAAWATLAEGALATGEPADAGAASGCDPAAVAARATKAGPELRAAWLQTRHAPALDGLWLAPMEGLARLADVADDGLCALHPAPLETAIRLVALAALGEAERASEWRPVGIRAVRVLDGAARARWVHAAGARTRSGEVSGDVRLLDVGGRPVLVLEGLRLAAPDPAPLQTLLYEVTWVPQARPPRREGGRSARWLLLGSPASRLAPLVAHLEAHGHGAVVVDPGGAAAELGARLDALLREHGPEVVGVVHLAALDLDPAAAPTAAAAARGSWASALAAVQALARHGGAVSPRLWLVTAGAQLAASGDATVSLPSATLWGLGAVVVHEHPALRCARVDLALRWAEPDLADLGDELLADGEDDHVAFRRGQRLVARLARRAAGPAVDGAPLSLVEPGTYLVAGGLGGLGLTVARWLVARGARHLVLVSRRGAPAAAAALAELRTAGAEVVVARGDVARAEDVRRIVGAIPESAPLRGIVHAAGVVDPALLVHLDEARVAAVMAPKVDGALNLHAATLDRPLDFFVLFSSVSAVLGVPGEGNYAPGNAVLDALAIRRRAEGRPALSILWGPWGEVGLVAARADGGNRLAARGLGTLDPLEGLRALEALLREQPATPLLVMRFTPDRWRRAYPQGARMLLRDLCSAAAADEADEGIATRLRAAAAADRLPLLEAWLREQVAQALHVAPAAVDRAEPLKTLGLDSMLSLELRNRIERAFAVALPATVIWNYPTLAALAPHLEARLGLAAVERADEPADARVVEQLLKEIEGLSEDEVSRLLAEGGAA